MPIARLAFVALLALAAPVQSQTTETPPAAEASLTAIADALQLDALFAVLREEGLAYGVTLEDEMFPGGGGPQWAGAVDAIYNVPALQSRFEAALARGLENHPDDVAAILDFYTSELGQRVVSLEIEARQTMIDDVAEDAARVAADKRLAGRDPLVGLIERFIAAADLIEMNVAGGLSGNLAFLTGMADTGLYGQAMPADELMSQVWSQEEQIRSDTTSWLQAYLGLAYAPLEADEMERYIAFMESPGGKRLNAAIFAAFDEVFRQVSHDLGRAAGVAIQGQDI